MARSKLGQWRGAADDVVKAVELAPTPRERRVLTQHARDLLSNLQNSDASVEVKNAGRRADARLPASPLVYAHYKSNADPPLLRQLGKEFVKNGFNLIGMEADSTSIGWRVDYFHQEDAQGAKDLAELVVTTTKNLGREIEIITRLVNPKIPKPFGFFGLWVPSSAREQPALAQAAVPDDLVPLTLQDRL